MTSLHEALAATKGRYDAVEAAYDGMDLVDSIVFRKAIQDPSYSHAQIAEALRTMGYDVDRKQVHHYREKLATGKATLIREPESWPNESD